MFQNRTPLYQGEFGGRAPMDVAGDSDPDEDPQADGFRNPLEEVGLVFVTWCSFNVSTFTNIAGARLSLSPNLGQEFNQAQPGARYLCVYQRSQKAPFGLAAWTLEVDWMCGRENVAWGLEIASSHLMVILRRRNCAHRAGGDSLRGRVPRPRRCAHW